MIDHLSMPLAQAAGDMLPMVEKLRYLKPEIVLFVATVLTMVVGLSPSRSVRRACAGVAVVGLGIAGVLAAFTPVMDASPVPGLMAYAKVLVAAVGILLVLLLTGTVDRAYERAIERGVAFDGIRSTRGEFFSFMLFSLTGLMLCAGADDLIWLFLALELTSLPTYVMVSISTSQSRSQEAGVKYFFLGAFGAAMFLFGFALIYGATGTTQLFAPPDTPSIAAAFSADGPGVIGTLGLVMALVGISFKIAAVPMHFYTPDVYEGAASSVSAFLAFVPKTAGFLALILLLSTVGWGGIEGDAGLPEVLRVTLWVMAALTMTVGNVLALLQQNVKRMLAYSSIAHSGYMLVGLIAGPGPAGGDLGSNGLAASLFYLLCYGFMNLGAFAVLASLERGASGEEIENVDDLRGLCATQPLLGWVMVLCAASLLGLPPLLGFVGKFYLFAAAISAGEIPLVVIMGVNSAIAAFYYLRLMGAPLLDAPTEQTRSLTRTPFGGRVFAAAASGASVVVLVVFSSWLMQRSAEAIRPLSGRVADVSRVDPAASGVSDVSVEPIGGRRNAE